MIWLNFLHIYQPANEGKEIFDRVVAECYQPLLESLRDHEQAKITLNINAVLTERLQKEYPELIEILKTVAGRGQVEFTDSAKYHALLPLLPEEEIERQITLNRETNGRILGDCYRPEGFFPPEMGYSPKLAAVLEKMGYRWVIIDEIAYNGKPDQVKNDRIYQIKGTNLKVFFRQRAPSNLIMSAYARSYRDLESFLHEDFTKKDYMVTGMDGETFGHHRPGLQTLLTEMLTADDFEHAFFSEVIQRFPEVEEVTPLTSTWASSQKDIEDGIQFISWSDPSNEIQKYQWELQRLVLEEIKSKNETGAAREKLDAALASDQFFWSSGRPWWSHEVIELGAWMLLDAVKSMEHPDPKVVEKACDLYLKILVTTFEWQRTGRVRSLSRETKETVRIPFKDRTAAEPWVYQAFIDLMRQEMAKAAAKENFEEAILWRDAIWKLETKNDIFDAVHAVDLLRKQIPDTTIREVLDKYTADYKKILSGQPEQRTL